MGLKVGSVLAVVITGAWLALAAPVASANTEEIIAPSKPPYTPASGWQAGTCESDSPTICSVATPTQFYREAGGHPQIGFTQFIVRYKTGIAGSEEPIDELAHVHVDIPEGFAVNPQATPSARTRSAKPTPDSCPANTEGRRKPDHRLGRSASLADRRHHRRSCYNIEPPEGRTGALRPRIGGANKVFLRSRASTGPATTTRDSRSTSRRLPLTGILLGGLILKNRLRFYGRSGDGTFLTTPTTCHDWEHEPAFEHVYSTYLLASAVKEEAKPGYVFPAGASPRARVAAARRAKNRSTVATIPYDPTVALSRKRRRPTRPPGRAPVNVPHMLSAAREESSQHQGSAVDTAAGHGAQPLGRQRAGDLHRRRVRQGNDQPGRLPGRVESRHRRRSNRRRCPTGSLERQRLRRQPAQPRPGLRQRVPDLRRRRVGALRHLGEVDRQGQRRPVDRPADDAFSGLPQVPFTSFTLKLDGGPRAVLTSPPICGPHTLTADDDALVGQPGREPTGQLHPDRAPGGGDCAKTLAERPFAPGFDATPSSTQAGALPDLKIESPAATASRS